MGYGLRKPTVSIRGRDVAAAALAEELDRRVKIGELDAYLADPDARETQHGLAWFRICFGMLQVKAYNKGEHMLRIEATVHNARELRFRRGLDTFPEIITRLAGIAERFATTLDCADISFLPDGVLDQLPLPSQIGTVRTGGIDLNKAHIRAALAAALALAPAPHGFTVADFAAKV